MNDHEKYSELATGYALGVLDEHDRHRFEFHLASGCGRCEQVLHDARIVADELSYLIEPIAPEEQVRDRLFERIDLDAEDSAEETDRPETRKAGNWVPFALAATLLLTIGLGYQTQVLKQKVQTVLDEHSTANRRIAELQISVDLLSAPQTQTVSLNGRDPIPGAEAKAFIDPAQRRLFLYVYNLPPTPPGKTYQLWLLVGGTPVSAGIFDVNPDGTGRFDAEKLSPFSGKVNVAVTIEPEGGVPQPTGPMVLLGSV